MAGKKSIITAIALCVVAVYFFWDSPSRSRQNKPQDKPQEAARSDALPQSSSTTPPIVARSAGAAARDPLGTVAPPTAAPSGLPPSNNPKINLLREIFSTRNDNDLRMDSELKVLDEQTKGDLRDEYLRLPKEKLNERGTIVFLLGRNLTRSNDFEFLESILRESACLSLANCQSPPLDKPDSEHLHHESGTEITLAYPQIVAIKAAENFLRANSRSHPLYKDARQAVENARKSTIAPVRAIAEAIAL